MAILSLMDISLFGKNENRITLAIRSLFMGNFSNALNQPLLSKLTFK